MQRRDILKAICASQGLLALGLPLPGKAETAPLNRQQLGDNLWLLSGEGGNITAFSGKQALTLIDTGSTADALRLPAVLAEIGQGKPLATVFNTHWHPDHTGGNAQAHKLGAQIHAHENTRLWLGADFEVYWREEHIHPQPPEFWPDHTYYESGAMDLDGEMVQFIHSPQAHTDGDLFLFFPDSNVLVAGGLLSHYRYPTPDIASGGWIGGLLEANAAMLALADNDTLIVPQRGPALRKSDLEAQHNMLADLYEKMKNLARQGFSGHDMLQAGVTSEYDERWGDPSEFVLETYRGMWAHTYDMGGFI